MRFDIITLFPEMFPQVLSTSILGRACQQGALEVVTHDLRTWTYDPHRTVDDTPYGGGAGMVMKPAPLFEAVEAVTQLRGHKPLTIFFTPGGEPFTERVAQDLAELDDMVLVCGRYEGMDERAVESLADKEISLGDYVLTGGELPAMVLIDAVTRLLPGVLGDDMSALDESFSDGLLEFPQYTRPAEYRGLKVPSVLLSGNHAKIAQWRLEQAEQRTRERRPDLWDAYDEDKDEM